MQPIINNHTALTQQGSRYLCLCPWHDEKTPSMIIDGGRLINGGSILHLFGCECLSCGAKGGAVVVKRDGGDYAVAFIPDEQMRKEHPDYS
jgi:hypothetical protein